MRQAAHVLAAFDAGLEPLRGALDPCRNPVPPCRRPPKRRRAEGPGAASGPGVQSGSESQAAALEALAARVAAATRCSVVLARGSGNSSGRTSASSSPCALCPHIGCVNRHDTAVQHRHFRPFPSWRTLRSCILLCTRRSTAAPAQSQTLELYDKTPPPELLVQARGGRDNRQSQTLNQVKFLGLLGAGVQ